MLTLTPERVAELRGLTELQVRIGGRECLMSAAHPRELLALLDTYTAHQQQAELLADLAVVHEEQFKELEQLKAQIAAAPVRWLESKHAGARIAIFTSEDMSNHSGWESARLLREPAP